jgi:hypothetical protein
MYIKRYTVAAVIWMALVGWYVYAYITHDTMGLDFFGIPLPSLSIALWIVVPVFVLYVGSVLHMAFYSFLGGLKLRKYEQDYEKMIDAIVDAYLGKKDRSYTFKTERYKLLGSLLEKTSLTPTEELIGMTGNEKIDHILRALEKIKRGEVVDLKQYGLSSQNPLVIQNEKNKYKMGALSATTILSNPSKYDRSFCEEVYAEYVKTAPLADIEKYKEFLTKEALYNIFARINADENRLDISNETLIELMKQLDLGKKEYIEISSILAKSGMVPEQRMKLFEVLGDEDEDAMEAYLYTLFDLEMLAPAKEILQNSHADEFQNFKAYYALKECGKNFSIELFV